MGYTFIYLFSTGGMVGEGSDPQTFPPCLEWKGNIKFRIHQMEYSVPLFEQRRGGGGGGWLALDFLVLLFAEWEEDAEGWVEINWMALKELLGKTHYCFHFIAISPPPTRLSVSHFPIVLHRPRRKSRLFLCRRSLVHSLSSNSQVLLLKPLRRAEHTEAHRERTCPRNI